MYCNLCGGTTVQPSGWQAPYCLVCGAGQGREYWHETLAAAIADANRWNGRACVVPAGDRFRVVGGAMSFALYVTIGCRYRDWEREAADRA